MSGNINKSWIIACDFDGTCVTHSFPLMGREIGAAPVLKKLVDNGHKLILYTMRCKKHPETKRDEYQIHAGDFLTPAINWFKGHEIPLYGVQRDPSQGYWTDSPKCYANLYIDDAALGIPLKFDQTISDKPFVDWEQVEILLKEKNLIK